MREKDGRAIWYLLPKRHIVHNGVLISKPEGNQTILPPSAPRDGGGPYICARGAD